MPRPPNTDARRAQIVAGLRQILPERGYAGASVQRIAKAAGVAPGLVHYHFGSKQEILVALVAQLADELRARLPEGDGSPKATLHGVVDAWLGLGPGADLDAVRCWVVLGAEAMWQDEVRSVYAAAVADAVGALEGLLADARSDWSGERARRAALSIHAAIEGFFQLSATDLVPTGAAASSVHALLDALLEGP